MNLTENIENENLSLNNQYEEDFYSIATPQEIYLLNLKQEANFIKQNITYFLSRDNCF